MDQSVSSRLPYPPPELVGYVGTAPRGRELPFYELVGASARELICSMLPGDWTFEGKRVLDFGCGAGRVIRHFAAEAENAEFAGCDIDQASIRWAHGNLTPPFRFFQNDELPPLDEREASFDLIYGMSVFTHLPDTWSEWLLELHRVLRPGGFLVLSFLGEGMVEHLTGEPYDDDRIGKNEIGIGTPWSEGGPCVLHSPWWIRAHWGRAYEVIDLLPHTEVERRFGHGLVCLRKDARKPPGADELERPEPGEPRELGSLRHNVLQLTRELRHLRKEALLTRFGLDRSLLAHRIAGRVLALPPERMQDDLEGAALQLADLKARIVSAREQLDELRERRSMGDPGLEPGTSSLSEKRSNRLS
jgi:SAM-dependent methyltransferase